MSKLASTQKKEKNHSLGLINKLKDFAKTAALDLETIVEEKLKDPLNDSVKNGSNEVQNQRPNLIDREIKL